LDILSGLFHHGLLVDDLDTAMSGLSGSLGIAWAPVREFDPLPVWTPEGGRTEARLRVAYSRPGPVRLELVEAAPGSPYDAMRALDRSHIGVWVDDVGDGVERLLAQGWRLLLSGASDRRRYGSIAYLAQDGGPVVELVSRELVPVLQAWWDS